MNKIKNNSRSFVVIMILIVSFLFCSSAPLFMTMDSGMCDTIETLTHSKANMVDTACAGDAATGKHIFNFVSIVNVITWILPLTVVFFLILSRKDLFAVGRYITKLLLIQRLHRMLIKPKLEQPLLRWLNLLGGSIAWGL